MREYTISEIEAGMRESFQRQITEEMEEAFRMISGDDNPLHRDDDFAREVSKGRFPKHVAFGMLTASLYSTLAGMYLPGRYSMIHSFEELSFLNPVFTGDVLTVCGEVIDKNEDLGLLQLKAVIKNQENKSVSRAKMKVLVINQKNLREDLS